jgi:hypothetical protein
VDERRHGACSWSPGSTAVVDSQMCATEPGRRVRVNGEDKVMTEQPRERELDILIGSWINRGETVPTDGGPAVPILTSDTYLWTAGGHFVLHTAFGQIGDLDVGGTELIGWDDATGAYRSYFFDFQGDASVHRLTVQDGTWTWTDDHSARCRATFDPDGRVQTAPPTPTTAADEATAATVPAAHLLRSGRSRTWPR